MASLSLDINPMDFAILSVLESEVSKVFYISVNNLKQALTEAWSDLDEPLLRFSYGPTRENDEGKRR